jgi:8-oxo-dGTP pyrophosphatase MutT (NUDIX family)
MPKRKIRDSTQFAALPCRIAEDGSRQVMLLTSRETRRWVIPKGWPMKGLKPPQVAAREAYEEAGLVGRIIGKRPVGVFHYQKNLPKDQLLCEVQVFLLWVDRQLDDWPEKGQRETKWFDPDEAAGLVDEGGLAEIVRRAVVTGTATKGSRKQPRKRRLLPQPQPAR